MYYRKNLCLIGCLVLVVSGCSIYRVTSQDTTTTYYPSKPSSHDVLYAENLDRAHEIIGRVTVNADRNQRIGNVIEKMKWEAAILGGDAITDIKSDADGFWKKLPAQKIIGNGYTRANFTASVVVFK
jgi:hypothetical protein